MAEEKKKPEWKVRVGPVVATAWENGEEGKKFLTVNLTRNYKNKDGDWKETNGYGKNDIPKAVLALNLAYEKMCVKAESQE